MAFKAGAIVGTASLDTRKWTSGMKRLTTSTTVAFAVIGAAVTAAMVKSVSMANEFQKAMSNVSTLVDTATIDMQALARQVLTLSPELGDATDLTRGLYQAFSAGAVDAKDAMQITTDSAMFAKAALTDTFTAVDVLTTAVNAYGREAMTSAQASDIFFLTIKKGKVTGEELAAAIGMSIPLFANVGISLEELSAGLAAMTKQGVKARRATTQMNAIVNAFLKPSLDMQAALADIGAESGAAFLKAEGLTGALELLTTAADGDASAMAALVPNVRGLRGVMALSGIGAQTFKDTLLEMEDAVGVTQEAFEKQEKTFDTLKASMGRIQIVLGEVGRLLAVDLAEGATKAATWFVNLDEETLDLIKSFIKGTVIILAVVAGIYALSVAVGVLNAAFVFLAANPIVAVIAGISLVTVGIIALTDKVHQDRIEELTEKFGSLAEATGIAKEEIEQFVDAADLIEGALGRNCDSSIKSVTHQVSQLSINMGLTREQVIRIGIRSDYITESMRSTLLVMKEQLIIEEAFHVAEAERLKHLEDRLFQGRVYVDLVAEEEAKQKAIVDLIVEQIRLEKERISGVIKDRKSATEQYAKSIEESAVKLNLSFIKEEESLRSNIAATEAFVNALVTIGYDGADAVQIGNRQLLESLSILADLKIELAGLEHVFQDVGAGVATTLESMNRYLEVGIQGTVEEVIEETKVTWNDYFNTILSGVSAMYSGLANIGAMARDNESRELELEQQVEQEALEQRLKQGLITEEEYEEQREEMEEKQKAKRNELAEKAFEAEKKTRIAGVMIDTAGAIAGWWRAATSLGPIAGIVFGSMMSTASLIMAGKQAALINQQKFVPAMARGGTVRINERGGEIVTLPDGSQVIPNDISRQIAANVGTTINISFSGARISDDMDLKHVTDVVIRRLGKQMRLAG